MWQQWFSMNISQNEFCSEVLASFSIEPEYYVLLKIIHFKKTYIDITVPVSKCI